ncbi:hypothetical protein [Enhygromyxa salina]|uniref:Uncharacterized protein n=1 Tax=Enhygromyxa salina TaxID=215803 RepID=A0A2S9YJC3_9BACT|nr:hypothetical protein [Enhygromyxa salina]PRQ05142.1 hypothetical protein ENSA7_47710 [Enhygromyxa salina]
MVILAATIEGEPGSQHVVFAVYRNESKIELRERSHHGGMRL